MSKDLDERTLSFLRALERVELRKTMPTYDYRCPKCEMTITVVRGLEEEEKKPTCINDKIELVRDYRGSPTVKFKGNGFYTTDK